MKKLKNYLSIILISFTLVGCIQNPIKKVLMSESSVNFSIYMNQINDVVNSHDLTMIEDTDQNFNDPNQILKIFKIIISDNQFVRIKLLNSGGRESFGIYYITSLDYINDDFTRINIDLFIELANVISGKRITKEFCLNFLTSSESQYGSEKVGIIKTKDELIFKAHDFNFTSDWSMYYVLYVNLEEWYSFVGLTKKGIQ